MPPSIGTAVQLLMQHCYIPAPRSIYAGVHKLPAGSLLTVPIDHTNGDLPEPVRWWDIRDVADLQRSAVFSGSQEDAINRLEELLSDAVGARMLSDVPLGAFLSGGIDSSLVVALMQKQSSQPVQTFSIGFDEEQYNEATHAKAVASHLGTQHTELYVTPQQARDVIPQLPTMSTNHSLTRRRSPRTWSHSLHASTSRCHCPETAATNCSADTTATSICFHAGG